MSGKNPKFKHKIIKPNQCCVCMEEKNENNFFKRGVRVKNRNFCFSCINKYNELIINPNKYPVYKNNIKIFDTAQKYEVKEETKFLNKIYSVLTWNNLPKVERSEIIKNKYKKVNKENKNENQRKYRKNNKEKVAEYGKKYSKLDSFKQRRKKYRSEPGVKAKELAQKREYRNSEKGKAAELAYRNSPAGKAGAKLRKAKRRALELKAKIVKITKEQLQQRMSVFGYKCYYCDGPFEHLDHAIALSKGGYHCLANFRPSCESCNLSKGSKSYKEWIKSLPKFNKDLNKEEIKKDDNNEGSNKDNN